MTLLSPDPWPSCPVKSIDGTGYLEYKRNIELFHVTIQKGTLPMGNYLKMGIRFS
jgi:hypothetical protein